MGSIIPLLYRIPESGLSGGSRRGDGKQVREKVTGSVVLFVSESQVEKFRSLTWTFLISSNWE